jgi:hypothetical protein
MDSTHNHLSKIRKKSKDTYQRGHPNHKHIKRPTLLMLGAVLGALLRAIRT